MISTIDELYKFFTTHDNIYIYGTGMRSDTLFNYILEQKFENKISGYIVTNVSIRTFLGKPVYGINEIKDTKSITILIAAGEIFQDEISHNLLNIGVTSFFLISDDLSVKIRHINNKNEETNYEIKFFKKIESADYKNKLLREILLINPPYWDVYAPFSATPSLTAYLKERNIKIEQMDLGIECFHTLIESEGKKVVRNILSKDFYIQNIEIYKNNTCKNYEEYKEKLWFLNENFFSFENVKKIYNDLDTIQQFALSEFYSKTLNLEQQYINLNRSKIDLEQIIKNTSWLTLWKTLLTDKNINEFSNLPSFVGISTTGISQLTSAFKLASIIKQISPNIKLVLGGSAADLFMESLYINKKIIFKYFDYVVIGEGETALFKLYNYIIKHQGNIMDIPNLSFLDDNENIHINNLILEDVETLPTPDYTGLNLNLYVAPHIILPYQASRGCHYGYCAFCNHNEKYRHNYRTKSAVKVVSDLCKLSKKYNAQNFQFVDEAIQPVKFKELISEMERNPNFLDINWLYYSRVSLEYNTEILNIARKVGLKMVMFGIETFNNRLLKFIKKGIVSETSVKTLKLFHEAGIKTFAWMMCNLPSETIKETKEDIQKLKEQSVNIDAVSVGMFSLEINTDMYKNPEKFNIVSIDNDNGTMFSSNNKEMIIDKNAIIECFRCEYIPMVKNYFLTGNRYFLYFK